MRTKRMSGIPLALAAALAGTGGCGLAPGTEIVVDLVGTWGSSGGVVANTLEYLLDGTFRATAEGSGISSGPMAGCTVHRVTTGRYTASAEERTITQSGAAAKSSLTGCADPAANMPETQLPPEQAAGLNTTFTYTLSGNTLLLRARSGATVSYTRR